MRSLKLEGIITVRLLKSCGSAKPYRQEKLRARALHDENGRYPLNGRGSPMLVMYAAAGVLSGPVF